MVTAAIMHISASAAGEAEPTVSRSNCMNLTKSPGPVFVAVDVTGAELRYGVLGDCRSSRRP